MWRTSTPPELAGACVAAAALRPRRPVGQRLSLHLGTPGTPGVPISYRGTGCRPEQGRCALHRARGGGAHRAGPCAAARAGAGRLQGYMVGRDVSAGELAVLTDLKTPTGFRITAA